MDKMTVEQFMQSVCEAMGLRKVTELTLTYNWQERVLRCRATYISNGSEDVVTDMKIGSIKFVEDE